MIRSKQARILYFGAMLIAVGGTTLSPHSVRSHERRADDGGTSYRSPYSVVTSPDGQTVYASDRTGGRLVILDATQMTPRNEIALHGNPHGLALSDDGSTLYVAEHGAGSVAVVDAKKQEIISRISVGKWPTAVAVADEMGRLYVGNQNRHSVSVIDLNQTPAKVTKEIPVVREPSCLAVTPDEQYIVVANLLAHGKGTDPTLAAELSIINGGTLETAGTVKLPTGSTMVQGVCVSPNGNWAYVVHGLGRFNLPITQLERGWVNTFALSVIDIAKGSRLATVLLDDLTQGAADPHSVVCSGDGRRLWISHTGVHEISFIDIGLVHELLDGESARGIGVAQGRKPGEHLGADSAGLEQDCSSRKRSDCTLHSRSNSPIHFRRNGTPGIGSVTRWPTTLCGQLLLGVGGRVGREGRQPAGDHSAGTATRTKLGATR